MESKNVGFVNIRAVASEEVTRPHYIDIGVSVIYPNSSVDVAACGAKLPATVKPHDCVSRCLGQAMCSTCFSLRNGARRLQSGVLRSWAARNVVPSSVRQSPTDT